MKSIVINERVSLEIDKEIAAIVVSNQSTIAIDAVLYEGLSKALDEVKRTPKLSALLLLGETLFVSETSKNADYPDFSLLIENLDLPVFALLETPEVCSEAEDNLTLLNQVSVSLACKAFIHLYFAQRNTLQHYGLNCTDFKQIEKVAVIGAGTMGGGIAMCFANAGIPVILVDANAEALDRGIKTVEANYVRSVNRGRMSEAQHCSAVGLIEGSIELDSVADADLIIEAVYEDMALKRRIFKDIDGHAHARAILATNTSTFDINEIASVTSHPENVVGLHFFSPANVMPLVEVVRTDSTSEQVLATSMSVVKGIGKTPVEAKICYGFIGNRLMEGYAREAELMALEGAAPSQIDRALTNFGMAMGILSVFDMAGIDVGVKAHVANADKLPKDPTYYQASQALFDSGRLGQKTGRGFYQYQVGDRRPYEDVSAFDIIRARAESLGVSRRTDHSEQEIIERCIYPLLNEAIVILDEGIALKASDVDVVWTLGYGFPRYKGGPLYYADSLGLKNLYEGMLKYQDKFGSLYWRPARLLQQLVDDGLSIRDWESLRAQDVNADR